MLANASEIEAMNKKLLVHQSDSTTKESLRQESEALYAKCQILEGQLERLAVENDHIREAQAKELQQDFNVSSYIKWRSTFKQPEIQFTEDGSTPNLALQRENLKLKDEVMQLRVELFGLRQKMDEWKEQTKQFEMQIENEKAELKAVQDRLAQSVLKTTALIDEISAEKNKNRDLMF